MSVHAPPGRKEKGKKSFPVASSALHSVHTSLGRSVVREHRPTQETPEGAWSADPLTES